MKPAGLSEVQKAKADGRWSAAYQSQGKAGPPSDFLAALAANAEAERAFATLDRANRYAFVYRVNDAKRPETRNKRIREFVEMLARGDPFIQPKAERTKGPDRAAEQRINALGWLAQVRSGSNSEVQAPNRVVSFPLKYGHHRAVL